MLHARRRSLRCGTLCSAALGLIAVLGSPVDGAKPQEKPAEKAAAKPPQPARETAPALPAFTPEREAAALTFVTTHHPELAPLLGQLKTSRPLEYQNVVRQLFSDSERLARLRESTPPLYELELKEWKLESQIHLLLAHMALERTSELEQALKRALEAQLQIHRAKLEFRHRRAAESVAAAEESLRDFDQRRTQLLDDLYDKAIQSTGRMTVRMKVTTRDAKESAAKNSDEEAGK